MLKESGKVIGEIFGHPEGADPENEDQDTFSPCWMLNLDYTGKGYAYEAAHAYFDYLFKQRSIRRFLPIPRTTTIPANGCVKSSA